MIKFLAKLLNSLIIITITYVIVACAQVVAPSGGPKDVEPPVVIKTKPAENAVNQSLINKIYISFNEYIQLKNANEQILFSPPLAQKPSFKLKGKTLVVALNDTLKENTTYSIFFGNSIADFNEGNPLNNYKYSFSTGADIDSLTLKGRVIDAFTLKPIDNILVMLYSLNYDSIPYKSKPFYIGKTNVDGYFNLTNLKQAEYKIFALKDANYNYIYDLQTEMIAFSDSLVKVENIIINKSDSTTNELLNYSNTTLLAFTENNSSQKIISKTLINDNVLRIVFKNPTIEPKIEIIKEDITNKISTFIELSASLDTLTCWFYENYKDTVNFIILDKDMRNDTTKFVVKRKNIDNKKEILAKDLFNFTTNIVNEKINPDRSLIILSQNPLGSDDLYHIKLFQDDTIALKPKVSFTDSIKRHIMVKYEWKENKNYSVIIDSTAFTDIYNKKNNKLKINFSILSHYETGTLILDIESEKNHKYILQLIDNNADKIIRENISLGSKKVKFDYLSPNKYKIRLIYDSNNNNKWDTGNYSKHIQPEKVIEFNKIIEIRSNWIAEETWVIE